MASKWKTIGDHLGVPVSELEAIQENNRGTRDMCGDCLRDMYIWWLRNGEEVTAQKLAKTVHEVGEHSAERKLYLRFGKLSVEFVVVCDEERNYCIIRKFGSLAVRATTARLKIRQYFSVTHIHVT